MNKKILSSILFIFLFLIYQTLQYPFTADPIQPVYDLQTRYCESSLFRNLIFNDSTNGGVIFNYKPNCFNENSNWARIMLNVSCSVTNGTQYDRTMLLYFNSKNQIGLAFLGMLNLKDHF